MKLNLNAKSKLSVVYSRASVGISAPLVRVETHVSYGMPGFTIVGLPEAAVKESRERVRSAIINSGLQFTNKKIIINLSPADLPKEGGRFDLPIAIGILAATGQLKLAKLQNFEFAGELALTGELRPISGAISLGIATQKTGRSLIIPKENYTQVSLIANFIIYPACNLLEVYNHLLNIQPIKLKSISFIEHTNVITTPMEVIEAVVEPKETITTISISNSNHLGYSENQRLRKTDDLINNIDLGDIVGQFHAKRALEITAAGGHNLLMVGPPGTGKTMLASRLSTILPEISIEQSLEVAAIYSLKGLDYDILSRIRPFRNPHHTISSAALVGGGSTPKPGEISLAHHGILFLDELPEFNRSVLEVLREPMESGKIIISRSKQQIELPARFQLVAAMNPCPCGNRGNPNVTCSCSYHLVKKYLSKISGPLLDRIDICIEVPTISIEDLTNFNNSNGNNFDRSKKPDASARIIPDGTINEATALKNNQHNYTSLAIKKKIEKAYEIQLARQNHLNAFLSNKMLKRYCYLDAQSHNLMYLAVKKMKLSARGYYRILKVSRTIADLCSKENVEIEHLQEAIAFNKLPILD